MRVTEQRLHRLAEKIARKGHAEITISDEEILKIARIIFDGLRSGYKSMPTDPEIKEAYLVLLGSYLELEDEPAIIEEIKQYLKSYENN
jgi:hypothetical protein